VATTDGETASQRRSTRASTAGTTERKRRVSIPGAMPEMDAIDEDEDVDQILELPSARSKKTSAKPQSRTPRGGRMSSAEPEESAPSQPVRRSSRLSSVEPVDSSPIKVKTRRRTSVEPTPIQPRMSTRRSKATTTDEE
jgi:hypothetical protein